MDALLLLAPAATSIGYAGRGDFAMAPDGRLRRRGEQRGRALSSMPAPPCWRPRCSQDAPAGAFSLTRLFDRAGEAGRLHGLRLEGVWMHVGTPDAIALAEAAIKASAAARPVRSSRVAESMPTCYSMRTAVRMRAMASKPRVFTIPASAPFLPTLIDALLDDRLGPGFQGGRRSAGARAARRSTCRRGAPAGWRATCSCKRSPTPRSCRASCRSATSTRTRSRSPKPRPARLRNRRWSCRDALGGLERRMVLAELILKWAQQLKPGMPGEAPLVAGNPASALMLAADLARLMDDMTTRQVSWDKLDGLVPPDMDQHWEMIVRVPQVRRAQRWPAILEEQGKIEPAERRDQLIEAERARLAKARRSGDRRGLDRLDAGDRGAAGDHRQAAARRGGAARARHRSRRRVVAERSAADDGRRARPSAIRHARAAAADRHRARRGDGAGASLRRTAASGSRPRRCGRPQQASCGRRGSLQRILPRTPRRRCRTWRWWRRPTPRRRRSPSPSRCARRSTRRARPPRW